MERRYRDCKRVQQFPTYVPENDDENEAAAEAETAGGINRICFF